MTEHAYEIYGADDEVALTLDFASPGYFLVAVEGIGGEVGYDNLLDVLLNDAPSLDTGSVIVRFDGEFAIVVTPAGAILLDEDEVDLLCEWLTNVSEEDWEEDPS
jgi:hypothetical protein